MVVHKSYEVSSFKTLSKENGTFEAIVSVFGNVDLQGDRVMPGAFSKTIEKWKASGDPIPVLWSHEWGDPFAHIGWADPHDVREVTPAKGSRVPGGLYVKGHLDVDKPFAKQVYDLLAERRLKEWSFSYDIPPGGEKRGKDGANELLSVDVIEIGPTLKGANPSTVSLGVKSRLDRAATMEFELERQKFDPSQPRDAVGQWTAGNAPSTYHGDGKPPADKPGPGHYGPGNHPLGEGTLNELRVALHDAGMSRHEVEQLAQRMRDNFQQTGHINIPKEADDFLKPADRERLGAAIRDEARKRGWVNPDTGKAAELAMYNEEIEQLAKSEFKWNGDAAMHSCHSAADFRKIAFERANDSDPDTAAHWALPHHSSPGADADPAGVAAALAALHGARGGSPDLKNKAGAESHLMAHSNASKNFDPSQLRDAIGRWTSGGGTPEVHSPPSVDRVSPAEAQDAVRTPPNEVKVGDRIIGYGERPATVTETHQLNVQGDQGATFIGFQYDHPHGGARSEGSSMTVNNDVGPTSQIRVLPPSADQRQRLGDSHPFNAPNHGFSSPTALREHLATEHNVPADQSRFAEEMHHMQAHQQGAFAPDEHLGGINNPNDPVRQSIESQRVGSYNGRERGTGRFVGFTPTPEEAQTVAGTGANGEALHIGDHVTWGSLPGSIVGQVYAPGAESYGQGYVMVGVPGEDTFRNLQESSLTLVPKRKSAKAGRVIGSKAAAALKSRLSDAVDAFVSDINGGSSSSDGEQPAAQEKHIAYGTRQDYGKGYADGTKGREIPDDATQQYLRGYEEGKSERASVEHSEIDEFNKIIEQLKES